MLNAACLIARKDLRLIITSGPGLVQSMLLGLVLIFVFSFSQDAGVVASPRAAATIFWLASLFCLVLAANMCHALEGPNNTRVGLLLAPVPVQGIWLGKAFAMLCILLLAQVCFLPAVIALLRQTLHNATLFSLGIVLLVDVGLVALAALLGALAQGRSGRESLLSIMFFPLVVPILLAGINCAEYALLYAAQQVEPAILRDWLGLVLAFDAIFFAAGLVLFPFIYTDEE